MFKKVVTLGILAATLIGCGSKQQIADKAPIKQKVLKPSAYDVRTMTTTEDIQDVWRAHDNHKDLRSVDYTWNRWLHSVATHTSDNNMTQKQFLSFRVGKPVTVEVNLKMHDGSTYTDQFQISKDQIKNKNATVGLLMPSDSLKEFSLKPIAPKKGRAWEYSVEKGTTVGYTRFARTRNYILGSIPGIVIAGGVTYISYGIGALALGGIDSSPELTRENHHIFTAQEKERWKKEGLESKEKQHMQLYSQK